MLMNTGINTAGKKAVCVFESRGQCGTESNFSKQLLGFIQ